MIKKRLNFVSNSSSSSYTCELCGDTEIYYDGDDNDTFYECGNGHIFCISCLDKYITEEMYNRAKRSLKSQIDKIINYQGNYDSDTFEEKKNDYISELENCDNIENFVHLEIYKGWMEQQDYVNQLMEELCPVCNFLVLLDYDYVNYVQKIFHIPPKDKLLENIRRTYLNYNEFVKKNHR